MDIDQLIQPFLDALDLLIRAVRGRSRTPIFNGVVIDETRHVYQFEAATQPTFSPNLRAFVEIDGETHSCSVFEIQGSAILLAFQHGLGDFIGQATLLTDRTFLFRAVRARLRELVGPDSARNSDLVLKLFGHRPAQVQTSIDVLPFLGGRVSEFNEEQLRAIGRGVNDEIAPILAGPGACKTHVAGGIVQVAVATGQRMLLLAPSKRAVGELMLSVLRGLQGSDCLAQGEVVCLAEPEPSQQAMLTPVLPKEILRRRHPALVTEYERLDRRQAELQQLLINVPQNQREQFRTELAVVLGNKNQLHREIASLETALVSNARILGLTLAKAAIDPQLYNRMFDRVLIDEAAMGLLPFVASAASLAQRGVVVLGDPRQLAPILESNSSRVRAVLGQDLFSYTGMDRALEGGASNGVVSTLRIQRRMHRRIREIVSRVFYSNTLSDDASVATETAPIVTRAPYADLPVVFCDIASLLPRCQVETNSNRPDLHVNVTSLLVSLSLSSEAITAGMQSLSLVAPYRAQSRLLTAAINDLSQRASISAGTVHVTQGGQSPGVIFDLVDTIPLRYPGRLLRGGLGSSGARTLCTGMCRARGKLILVGDWEFLRSRSAADSALRLVLDQINPTEIRGFAPTTASAGLLDQAGATLSWYSGFVSGHERLKEDFQAATRHVLINTPRMGDLDRLDPAWLAAIDPRRVLIRAPHLNGGWADLRNRGAIHSAEANFECVVILDSQIWRWPSGNDELQLVVRAHLPATALVLARLLGYHHALPAVARPAPLEPVLEGLPSAPLPAWQRPYDSVGSGRRKLVL